ncbi:hypothetical protein PQX77_009539 [Marasmius sp. AFHP31]|nr:hypothetical protein PQX77_009539 [Marasmius sp. AFHP31]
MASPREPQVGISPEILGPLWVFNVLQVIGFTLNWLILATAVISKEVNRTRVWHLFMTGWVFWCIAHALLFITGHQVGQDPPAGLCLFQAALIYAFPPCMELLTLGILAKLYCAMYAAIKERPSPQYLNTVVHYGPFIVFVGVFIEALVVGQMNPGSVMKDESLMHCNIQNAVPSPGRITAVIVGIGAVGMVILEGFVVATLYRNWNTLKRMRNSPGNVLSGTMAVRISVFSIMPLVALG